MATRPNVTQPDPFLARIAEFDDAVLREFYDRIGQIDYLYLPPLREGDKPRAINYGKKGPGLAVMKEKINDPRRPLLLLSPWTGLPDLQETTNEQCRACRAKCLDCNGEGKKTCTLGGCFGYGKRVIKAAEIDRDGNMITDAVTEDCPCCHGSGKETCGACGGGGQRATGYKDGAEYKPGMPILPAECQACKGNRLVLVPKQQPWEQFAAGRRGNYVAIGPIMRITYHTEGRQGAFESLNINPDSEGSGMVLLFDQGNKQHMRQYLMGGVAVQG